MRPDRLDHRPDTSRTAQGSSLRLSLVTAILRPHGTDLRLADNVPGLRTEFDLA
jgi:hypothetical protein